MVPIMGDENTVWYEDLLAQYSSDNNGSVSLGSGLRFATAYDQIFGVNVFVDYNDTDGQGNYWFISPGLEWMGLRWDLHLNGYIPISNQETFIDQAFGNTLGISTDVVNTGHVQFDNLFNVYAATGPGVDADFGYRWFAAFPLKSYIGGYHFSPKLGSDINGGRIKLVYPLNHRVSVMAEDSYDNTYHNTFAAGISFTLGGQAHDYKPQNIRDRILDPVDRNISDLTRGNTVPVIQTQQDTGITAVFRNNVQFFTAVGGNNYNPANQANNCTFENPCNASSFNQDVLAAINQFSPNAVFYFNTGNYSAINGSDAITLYNGQSFYGRTLDFRLAANGNQRPLFIGGFILSGNNTLDSIRVYQQGTEIVRGLTADGATNLLVNNSEIGDPNLSQGSYTRAIELSNGSTMTVNNSTITANPANLSPPFETYGVLAQSGSSITINNSTVTSNLPSNSGGGNETSYGIALVDSSLTMSNSVVSANVTGNNLGNFAAVGIYAGNGASANISSSAINVSGSTSAGILNITGLATVGSSTISLNNNSSINLQSSTGTQTLFSGSGISLDSSTICRKNGTIIPNCFPADK